MPRVIDEQLPETPICCLVIWIGQWAGILCLEPGHGFPAPPQLVAPGGELEQLSVQSGLPLLQLLDKAGERGHVWARRRHQRRVRRMHVSSLRRRLASDGPPQIGEFGEEDEYDR